MSSGAASPAAQRVQLPARVLRRACAEGGAERTREPPLERVSLARFLRIAAFGVERLCDGRRAAAVRELVDRDRPAVRSLRDLEHVALVNGLGCLDALAVDVHTPAQHGARREATRLEEARGPQPLVDAYLLHCRPGHAC